MIDAYILIIEDGYLSMFLKVPNDLTSMHDGGSMKFIFLKKFSHSDIHFQLGLFLHISPEVSPNFSLIESISVFLLPSPAVSIKLCIASVHKAKIVKAHLKFKKT